MVIGEPLRTFIAKPEKIAEPQQIPAEPSPAKQPAEPEAVPA